MDSFTAGIAIANVALQASQLVRRVFTAYTKAGELASRARDAGNLAQVIEEVIDNRKSTSPVENWILKSIGESLTELRTCLESIVSEIQALDNAQPEHLLRELKKRLRFVRAEDFLKDQQCQLDSHFRNLTLYFGVLNSFDLHVLRRKTVRRDSVINRITEAATVPSPDDARRNAEASHRQSTVKVTGDVTAKDPHGWNILHRAADSLDVIAIQRLFQSPQAQEPDFVNAFTDGGQTALMIAAKHANSAEALGVAKALIENGCDIDLRDTTQIEGPRGAVGRTALYHAVSGPTTRSRLNFVLALVDSGANIRQLREDYKDKYQKLQKFEASRARQQLPQQNDEPSDQYQEWFQLERRNTIAVMHAEEFPERAAGRQRQNSEPVLGTSPGTSSGRNSFSSFREKFKRTVSSSAQSSTNSRMRKSSKGDG